LHVIRLGSTALWRIPSASEISRKVPEKGLLSERIKQLVPVGIATDRNGSRAKALFLRHLHEKS